MEVDGQPLLALAQALSTYLHGSDRRSRLDVRTAARNHVSFAFPVTRVGILLVRIHAHRAATRHQRIRKSLDFSHFFRFESIGNSEIKSGGVGTNMAPQRRSDGIWPYFHHAEIKEMRCRVTKRQPCPSQLVN